MDIAFKNTDCNPVGYYWNVLRSLSKKYTIGLGGETYLLCIK